MKILHVTKKYPNALGGDAVVVASLEKQQVQNGDETVILTSNCDDIKGDDHIHKFGFKDSSQGLDRISFKRLMSLPLLTIKAFSIIRREKPDIIHSHAVDLTLFISIAARFYKIPVINTFHIITFNDLQQSLLRRSTELLLLRISKVMSVTVPNSYDAERLANAGVRNVYVLFNGIDLDIWKYGHEEHEKMSVFKFISVGRLEKQKGFEHIIRAAALLNRTISQKFHITIVGEGSLFNHLVSLCEELGVTDLVTFAGYKTPAETRQLLSDSDAMIIASLWETTPLTLLEAWAVGLPVISTPVGILRTEMTNRVASIVESNNPEAIKVGMLGFLTDRKILKKLQLNGYKEVVRKYTWHETSKTMDQLYTDAMI